MARKTDIQEENIEQKPVTTVGIASAPSPLKTVAALEDEVAELKRIITLMMVATPMWTGYTSEDSRYIESWYRDARKELDIRSVGVRD